MHATKLTSLLKIMIPARKPVLVKGRPGVGKSEIIAQVAADLGYDLVTWHGVTADPVDLKGFPFMAETKGKRTADFIPYGDLEAILNPKGKTVCLLEDFGHASPAVQASMMHPVLARAIGRHKISDDVSFVVATNRREDKAGVVGLITPFVDRMVMVVQLDPNANDWVRWGLRAGVPPVLLAFVKLRPKYIEEAEVSRDIVKTPSSRTLYEVGEMLKLGITDPEAICCAAGEAFGTEFMAFYSTFGDMPDRDEVIMNPMTAPVPAADRPDVTLALMGALAHVAARNNFDSIVQYLDRLSPEYAVCCIKNATARDRSLVSTAAYISFVTRNQEMFGMAGVK